MVSLSNHPEQGAVGASVEGRKIDVITGAHAKLSSVFG